MSTHAPAPTTKLRRVAKGREPRYFADPATDKLLSMVLALTQELSVARDRIDTLERLLDRKGLLAASSVDTYLPTTEEAGQRAVVRMAMLRRVFRAVEKEAAGLEGDAGTVQPDQVADLLS